MRRVANGLSLAAASRASFPPVARPRVVGLHISRSGDGMNVEYRPVKSGAMLAYTIGRTYLLELYQNELQSDQVHIVDSAISRRAYEQLMALRSRCERPALPISASRASTMILAFPAPCWRGWRGTRISSTGSAQWKPHAGRPGRGKTSVG